MASQWPDIVEWGNFQENKIYKALWKACAERGGLKVSPVEAGHEDDRGWYIRHADLLSNPRAENTDYYAFKDSMIGWHRKYGCEGFRDATEPTPPGMLEPYTNYVPYRTFSWWLIQNCVRGLCTGGWVKKGATGGTAEIIPFDRPRFFRAAGFGLHFRRTTVSPKLPEFEGFRHGMVRTNRIYPEECTSSQNYAPHFDNAPHLEVTCEPKLIFRDGDDEPYYEPHCCCEGVLETYSSNADKYEYGNYYCFKHDTEGWVIKYSAANPPNLSIDPDDTRYWKRTSGSDIHGAGGYTPQNDDPNGFSTCNPASVSWYDEPGDIWLSTGTTSTNKTNIIGDYAVRHFYNPADGNRKHGTIGSTDQDYYKRLNYERLDEYMIFYNDDPLLMDGVGWKIAKEFEDDIGSEPWWNLTSGSGPKGIYTPGSAAGAAGEVEVRDSNDNPAANPEAPACYTVRAVQSLADATLYGKWTFAGRVGIIPYYHKWNGSQEFRLWLDGSMWKIQKKEDGSWVTYWTKTGSTTYETARERVQGVWTPEDEDDETILVTRNRPLSDILGLWIYEDLKDGLNELVWRRSSASWQAQKNSSNDNIRKECAIMFAATEAGAFSQMQAAFPQNEYTDLVADTPRLYHTSIMWWEWVGDHYEYSSLGDTAVGYARGTPASFNGSSGSVPIDFWTYVYLAKPGYSNCEFNDGGVSGLIEEAWHLIESKSGTVGTQVYTTNRFGESDCPDDFMSGAKTIWGHMASKPFIVSKYNAGVTPAFDYY